MARYENEGQEDRKIQGDGIPPLNKCIGQAILEAVAIYASTRRPLQV
jgi:hypothetical protein